MIATLDLLFVPLPATAQSSSGYSTISIPDTEWAKVNDPPMSKADLDLAVTAIHNQVPIMKAYNAFVPPDSTAPAAQIDVDQAVTAIGDHPCAAPSDCSPLPSNVPPAAAPLSEPAAAPASAPSIPISNWSALHPASPAPAAPHSASPALSTSDATAPGSIHHNIMFLKSVYPKLLDKFLYCTLEHNSFDRAIAAAWLATFEELESMVSALMEAFPKANIDHIWQVLEASGGDISVTFLAMTKTHICSWDSDPKSSVPHCRLHSSLYVQGSSDKEDILVASDNAISFMQKWWSALLNMCHYHMGSTPPFPDSWSPLCNLAASNTVVSPCFISFVGALGLWRSNCEAFRAATCALHELPSYVALSSSLTDMCPEATAILPLLLEDSLILPAGALWLALNTNTDPSSYSKYAAG